MRERPPAPFFGNQKIVLAPPKMRHICHSGWFAVKLRCSQGTVRRTRQHLGNWRRPQGKAARAQREGAGAQASPVEQAEALTIALRAQAYVPRGEAQRPLGYQSEARSRSATTSMRVDNVDTTPQQGRRPKSL